MIRDHGGPPIWINFISHLRSELKFRRGRPRKLKPLSRRKKRSSDEDQRRAEKNHFKPWETLTVEDDLGITAWVKSKELQEQKQDEENELVLVRQYGVGKCPSIENTTEFLRESLHERFHPNCQFIGGETTPIDVEKDSCETRLQETPKPLEETLRVSPRPKITPSPHPSERPKSETFVTSISSPTKTSAETAVVRVANRNCKSAYSPHHPISRISLQNDSTHDVSPDLTRSNTCVDQSQGSSFNAVDLPESKTKVKKLMGLAQKYMSRSDAVKDEDEDCNDEGYDSKISSNDAEVVDDFRQIEEALLAREQCIAETYDVDQNNSNTFQWVRDPGGVSPGRIVKLSYSQREKTFHGLGEEKDTLLRTIPRPSTNNNFRGIMAASLSNLSPSSLNMRHFRDANSFNLMNCGIPGTTRIGYENTRGQSVPSQIDMSLTVSRPTTMVLRKVTVQDSQFENSDSVSKNRSPVPTSSDLPENTDRAPKVAISRTSPQLTVGASKTRNGTIPSQQQARRMSGRVTGRREELRTARSYDPREYIYNGSPSNSRIPIGDLLPAVEKSIQNTQSQRGKRGKGETGCQGNKGNNGVPPYPLTEDERAALMNRDADALHGAQDTLHGPPAFFPLSTRSPLQRAKEIANKRLHGHVTQNPDGTETVRVSSPRHQPRALYRRAGSAAGYAVSLALIGSNTRLQDRMSARAPYSRQSYQRPIQREM